MILSPLDKVPKVVFIVGGAIFLFLYCLATKESPVRYLTAGIFFLYGGIAMLYYYRISKEKPRMGTMKFRWLVSTILSILAGVWLIIEHFF